MGEDLLQAAHDRCSGHRAELDASSQCGCFHCLAIYPPEKIEEWTDQGTTAFCPYCGIDSVIGSAAGYPIATEFLREMRRYWFCCRPGPSRFARSLHSMLGTRHRRRWFEYQALLQRAETDAEYHREPILASRECGCFWCLAIFPPDAITKWEDPGPDCVDRSALCPQCGEPGVIGSADGFPITRQFLKQVRRPFRKSAGRAWS